MDRDGMRTRTVGVHVVLYQYLPGRDGDSMIGVFLVKRNYLGRIYQGCWALPGGEVMGEESYRDTAYREIKEELVGEALDKVPIRYLTDVKLARDPYEPRYIKYFCAYWPSDLTTDPQESIGGAWFTPNEVEHLYMRPEDKMALGQLYREVGI